MNPPLDPRAYIHPNNIDLDLKGDNKQSVVENLLDLFIGNGDLPSERRSQVLEELFHREAKGSTGIGHAIAIPHCKTDCVDKIIAGIGIHRKGVDFEAIDKKKSKIFILTLSPKNASMQHIEFLAFICNAFKDKNTTEAILTSKDAGSLFEILSHSAA